MIRLNARIQNGDRSALASSTLGPRLRSVYEWTAVSKRRGIEPVFLDRCDLARSGDRFEFFSSDLGHYERQAFDRFQNPACVGADLRPISLGGRRRQRLAQLHHVRLLF